MDSTTKPSSLIHGMRSRLNENCLTGMRTLQGTHILDIVILLLIIINREINITVTEL